MKQPPDRPPDLRAPLWLIALGATIFGGPGNTFDQVSQLKHPVAEVPSVQTDSIIMTTATKAMSVDNSAKGKSRGKQRHRDNACLPPLCHVGGIDSMILNAGVNGQAAQHEHLKMVELLNKDTFSMEQLRHQWQQKCSEISSFIMARLESQFAKNSSALGAEDSEVMMAGERLLMQHTVQELCNARAVPDGFTFDQWRLALNGALAAKVRGLNLLSTGQRIERDLAIQRERDVAARAAELEQEKQKRQAAEQAALQAQQNAALSHDLMKAEKQKRQAQEMRSASLARGLGNSQLAVVSTRSPYTIYRCKNRHSHPNGGDSSTCNAIQVVAKGANGTTPAPAACPQCYGWQVRWRTQAFHTNFEQEDKKLSPSEHDDLLNGVKTKRRREKRRYEEPPLLPNNTDVVPATIASSIAANAATPTAVKAGSPAVPLMRPQNLVFEPTGTVVTQEQLQFITAQKQQQREERAKIAEERARIAATESAVAAPPTPCPRTAAPGTPPPGISDETEGSVDYDDDDVLTDCTDHFINGGKA